MPRKIEEGLNLSQYVLLSLLSNYFPCSKWRIMWERVPIREHPSSHHALYKKWRIVSQLLTLMDGYWIMNSLSYGVNHLSNSCGSMFLSLTGDRLADDLENKCVLHVLLIAMFWLDVKSHDVFIFSFPLTSFARMFVD